MPEPCQDGSESSSAAIPLHLNCTVEDNDLGLPFMPGIDAFELGMQVNEVATTRLCRPLQTSVREARLLASRPALRSVGKMPLEVATFGWRFPPLRSNQPSTSIFACSAQTKGPRNQSLRGLTRNQPACCLRKT